MTRINTTNLMILFLSFTLTMGVGGCKNKQKIAEQQAVQIKAENTAKAKSILRSILNDDGKMTLAEKERLLLQAKGIGSDDPEVLDLIAQVEAQLERERESQAMANQKEVVLQQEERSLRDEVSSLFESIANSSSTAGANSLIDDGMDMFSSPDALVLIIISKSGDIKDYDEPTTILKYLNYLKDQRSNPNDILDLVLDDSGRIKEVELIKR